MVDVQDSDGIDPDTGGTMKKVLSDYTVTKFTDDSNRMVLSDILEPGEYVVLNKIDPVPPEE